MFGCECIIRKLVVHVYSRVYWDMTPKSLDVHKNRTSAFLDCPNVVAFIDGKMCTTYRKSILSEQQMDFNGWKHDFYRKMILVWGTFGKCVCCAVNCPGCMHDSRITEWFNIYELIEMLPEGYSVVGDSAFQKLRGDKLIKSSTGYNFVYFDWMDKIPSPSA